MKCWEEKNYVCVLYVVFKIYRNNIVMKPFMCIILNRKKKQWKKCKRGRERDWKKKCTRVSYIRRSNSLLANINI